MSNAANGGRTVVQGKQAMTPSEAFVETLVAQGVDTIFGIVGSAFMDALDLFPAAGIRFVPTVHEQGSAHMADGFSRVTGRHGVCMGQNGPGITNFVTAIAAAYWARSPVVAITPTRSRAPSRAASGSGQRLAMSVAQVMAKCPVWR